MFDFMENTAGAIMTPEYLRLRVGWNAEEALRVVRASGLDSDAIYTLYVVDEASRLVGSLDVHRLLAAEPGVAVEALMRRDAPSVRVDADRREAAILVRKYDLLGLPVVDQDGVLVGAIGVNSILDVIVDEDSDDFVRMAALLPDAEGGYLRSSPWKLAARRLPWLIALMLSAILCERLIHGYEDFLFTSGELGVLMISCIPMLMDTGGNAGSQSATAMVRALALGELPLREAGAALWKELRAAVLCGVGLALVNFGRLYFLSGTPLLSAAAVSAAVLLTVVAADLLGCVLPLLARVVHVDPALMSGPLMTTFIDVGALFILFELCSALR